VEVGARERDCVATPLVDDRLVRGDADNQVFEADVVQLSVVAGPPPRVVEECCGARRVKDFPPGAIDDSEVADDIPVLTLTFGDRPATRQRTGVRT